jgi:trehalose 6-phosphate synthase
MRTAFLDAENQRERSRYYTMERQAGTPLAGGDACCWRLRPDGGVAAWRSRASSACAHPAAWHAKISNQLLWFVQRHLANPFQEAALNPWVQEAWQNGYRVATQAIAACVSSEIERAPTNQSVVLWHNYYLSLASALIRQRNSTTLIQPFIHIPRPDVRCWYFLPGNISLDIFQGFVGNDIGGFQTVRDACNFLEGADTWLEGAPIDFANENMGWRADCTQVRASPLSISVTGKRAIVQRASGRRAARKIKPLPGKQTMIRGFQADGQLLEGYPALRHRQSMPE